MNHTYSAEAFPAKDRGKFMRFMEALTHFSGKWMPDALAFALLLTLVIFILALCLTPKAPMQILSSWGKGLWGLLGLAMQICLVMISGFVVADTRLVRKGMLWCIDLPKTKMGSQIMFVCLVAACYFLHWAFAMMMGLIIGREMAARKRGLGIHLAWIAAVPRCISLANNGPSVAAPLMMATPNNFMAKVTGVVPLSDTVFSPYFLLSNVILTVGLGVLLLKMAPSKEDAVEINDDLAKDVEVASAAADKKYAKSDLLGMTFAQRLEYSPVLPGIISVFGFIWLIDYFYKGGNLDLNSLNCIFLMTAFLLHGSVKGFAASVQRGVTTVGPIIVQYPLYAGIYGVISQSGLVEIMANFFTSFSTKYSFPFISFLYTAFINMFVPSSSTKFIIEAPYLFPAAISLESSVPQVIQAYMYGASITNMIQPFWHLPTLAAYKLKLSDILPFCIVCMGWLFVVALFHLLFLPLFFTF